MCSSVTSRNRGTVFSFSEMFAPFLSQVSSNVLAYLSFRAFSNGIPGKRSSCGAWFSFPTSDWPFAGREARGCSWGAPLRRSLHAALPWRRVARFARARPRSDSQGKGSVAFSEVDQCGEDFTKGVMRGFEIFSLRFIT